MTSRNGLGLVRKVIPVEQGLRHPKGRESKEISLVRKVIPVEQGLRLPYQIKFSIEVAPLERLFQ